MQGIFYTVRTKSKGTVLVALALTMFNFAHAQNIKFEGSEFEVSNVKASVIDFRGEKVMKVERDLNKLAFDPQRLEATVDEPTFLKLKDLDLENGTIEVKVYSQIQDPSPFQFAQGFIGLAYHIKEDNSAFESIYLRPKVGRSDNQAFRNKTVQYFSYPDYKFERLRKEAPGKYETSAPVDIEEWISLRIELKDEKAYLFVNDAAYSTFVVNKRLGKEKKGSVALWVDIGTIGYFKDLRITKK
ncbi:hypothetical protein [Sphingobacterium faecium]